MTSNHLKKKNEKGLETLIHAVRIYSQDIGMGFGIETTLADYMYQEKREEEDLPALKTALAHRYNDSKTIYKNTMEDSLRLSKTILITRWTKE